MSNATLLSAPQHPYISGRGLPKPPGYGPCPRGVPPPPPLPPPVPDCRPLPPPVPVASVVVDAPVEEYRVRRNSLWNLNGKNPFKRRSSVLSLFSRPAAGSVIEKDTSLAIMPAGATLLHQGSVAAIPSPNSGKPGWIACDAGMFKVFELPSSCMRQGQICTFQSNDKSTAKGIRVTHSVARPRVREAFDENGWAKCDSTLFVKNSRLAIRGTYQQNEFISFDGLDVYNESLHDHIDETLNAFVNTQGGTIFLGVRWEEHVICGCRLTLDEQNKLKNVVADITEKRWNPQMPNRASRVNVTFVPMCTASGEICSDYFVVRIGIQGPLFNAAGDQICFQMKKKNMEFFRDKSFNAERRR